MSAPGSADPDRDEYARVARFYDRLLDPVLRPARRELERAAQTLGAATILDVGCGTGAQAESLVRAGMRVTGVDRSPAMLAKARARGLNSAVFLQADARRLDFPDASFDLAVSTFVLHEMPKGTREAVLLEARRTAAAVALVDYIAPRGPRGWLALGLAHLPERAAGRRHFAMFREFLATGALLGLLERTGLTPFEVRPVISETIALVLAK